MLHLRNKYTVLLLLMCGVWGVVGSQRSGHGAACHALAPTACAAGLTCFNGACVPCSPDASCPTDYYCDEEARAGPTCTRKGLFSDFRVADAAASAAAFVGGMLAAGGGLGGGGIFVPVFILVADMTAHEAVPMSQVMIFGGGIVNLVMNMRVRHPLVPTRPLIDYNAALMLQPMMLSGTVVGVMLNAISPAWVLVILLVIVLVYASVRTTKRGLKTWREEAEMRAAERVESMPQPDGGLTVSLPPIHSAGPTHKVPQSLDYSSCPAGSDSGGSGASSVVSEEPARSNDSDQPCLVAEEGKVPEPCNDNDDFLPPATACAAKKAAAASHAKERRGTQGGAFGTSPLAADAAEVEVKVAEVSPRHVDMDAVVSSLQCAAARGGSVANAADECQLAVMEEEALEQRREAVLARLEGEDREQARPVMTLLAVFALLVISAVVRGGKLGQPSVLGVRTCSPAFWTSTAASVLAMMGVTAAIGARLRRRYAAQLRWEYTFVQGDIRWTASAVALYPALATLAGVMGGLLGIGGGMIMGPLLLELGLLPGPAAATSALTVLLSSAAGTLQFFLMGMIQLDRAAWYFCLGLAATFLGQTVINALVRRLRSSSVIVFTIVIVMVAATVLMTVVGVLNTTADLRNGADMGFRSMC